MKGSDWRSQRADAPGEGHEAHVTVKGSDRRVGVPGCERTRGVQAGRRRRRTWIGEEWAGGRGWCAWLSGTLSKANAFPGGPESAPGGAAFVVHTQGDDVLKTSVWVERAGVNGDLWVERRTRVEVYG